MAAGVNMTHWFQIWAKYCRDELSQQVPLAPQEGESGLQVRITAGLKIQVQIQVKVPFQAFQSKSIPQKIKVWLHEIPFKIQIQNEV